MKKILLIVMMLLLIPIDCYAIDFNKLLLESIIETDRYQSYQWHQYTKSNPLEQKIIIGEKKYIRKIYEKNPFVAGTSREEFNKRVDFYKKLIAGIENKFSYNAFLLLEIYNIYQNNINAKEWGLYQIWTIAYSWEF